MHLMTIMLFHTVIICLNIHKYWFNIVGDNLNYHLYHIWIPFHMYVTQNINNCKKSHQAAGFPKSQKRAQ